MRIINFSYIYSVSYVLYSVARMKGYIAVKEEKKKSFWDFLPKIFNLGDEKEVIFQPYVSKSQVSYRYERNLTTRKFPPMSIEVFVSGSIDDNLYVIVKVPSIGFDQWAPMNYCWGKNCWKLILDFDISEDVRLNRDDNHLEVLISTT